MKKINKYKNIFADGGREVANAQRQSAMKDMTALLCDDISRITLSCKGWGQSAKLKKHSGIWGKFGTAIQEVYPEPLYQVCPKSHF